MALAGRRISTTVSEESYAEQERDANSQLLELDKGLRSMRVGEQCETIVRFPRLFEKYPFPIIVNSAFLKLGDVFRTGSNFLRLCILNVTQQSTKHLEKIHNKDEFLRRIFAVTHSNDPIARSIAIRTLGSCASVISERKNVHNLIINSLDSHDLVELDAAIYAADKYAAVSRSFASSIANKLFEMISGLQTPVDIKLKLIPLFEHMHFDAAMAQRVREYTEEMLLSYPARGFVLVALNTLSKLSAKFIIDIPKQIELLLNYLKKDPRKCVKTLALKDMKLLASEGPHMWTTEHVEALCKFVIETPYEGLKSGGLQVLTSLSHTLAVGCFSTAPGSHALILCSSLCYHSNLLLSTNAAQLLSHIAMYKEKGSDETRDELMEEAATTLETQIIVASTDTDTHGLVPLKTCLMSIVRLCSANPSITDRFLDLMMSSLVSVSDECGILICETMSSLSGVNFDKLPALIPELMEMLKTLPEPKTTTAEKLRLSLLTLLFQVYGSDQLSSNSQSTVYEVMDHCNRWTAYRVGRQAARYGHHHAASFIFDRLSTQTSTEQYYFWLGALRDLSLAETALSEETTSLSNFMGSMAKAQSYYQKCVSALQAGTSPSESLEWQSRYVMLRSQVLQAYVQLAKSCCSFQTSPPPAIATSRTMTTGQEIHRYSHIVNQLQKCGSQFEALGKCYTELYQMSFDADPVSLRSLQIQQQSCQTISCVIENILNNFSKGQSEPSQVMNLLPQCNNKDIENSRLVAAFQEVSKTLQTTLGSPVDAPLTHLHMSCLHQCCRLLATVPLSVPRFFFQKLQSNNIKLAISPQATRSGEPVTVHFDTYLSLEVEGVVTHGQQTGLFRSIHAIRVHVRSEQQSRGPTVKEVKLKENPKNEMVQLTEPLNDYFSTQFLLAFPITGLHTVTIETAVEDESGVVWDMGPVSTLSVKSYDEAVQRQQQQQYAAKRQQQRAQQLAAQFS